MERMLIRNIMLQKKPSNLLTPYRPDDEEFVEELKPNQVSVWSLKTKGVQKQRSFQQLKLVMAAIRVVVHNTEDLNWDTLDKAKLSLKVALSYIDPSAAVVGPAGVVLKYRSFGYSDLRHMEACRLFDRALEHLASVINVSVETLVEMAMNREY